mgnify:CR=1 FL=1
MLKVDEAIYESNKIICRQISRLGESTRGEVSQEVLESLRHFVEHQHHIRIHRANALGSVHAAKLRHFNIQKDDVEPLAIVGYDLGTVRKSGNFQHTVVLAAVLVNHAAQLLPHIRLVIHHGNARHRAAPFLFGIQSTRQARKTAVPCAFTYNI